MKKHFGIICLLASLITYASHVYAVTDEEQETMDSIFANPGNLTDKEMFDAQNFNHQGHRDRKFQEECEERKKQDKNSRIDCGLNKVDPDGSWALMEQHIGKAYSMIFGGLSMVGGGGGPTTKTGTETVKVEGAKDKTQDKKTSDYCMYGAMGYEMVAMLIQNDLNGNVEQETAHIKDIQIRALTAYKKNHEARVRTATIQAAVYGSVSLCYAGYAAFAGGYTDPMLYAKGLGAVALTGLYYNKARRHKQAARSVQSIIEAMPDPGDCNPYTGTTCFCAEPTSKEMYPNEYEQVCVLKRGFNELADVNLGCGALANGQITFDKQCKCKETNTCFKAQVKAFNPKFKLGNNLINTANKGFDLLSSGDFDQARLASFSTESRSLALRASKGLKPKLRIPKLNPEQQEFAAELAKTMPADYAALAALAPSGAPPGGLGIGGGNSAGLDKLPPEVKKKVAEAIKGNYKKGSGNEKGFVEEEAGFQMPSFGGEKPQDSANVLSFAEKAVNNADVSNRPDTPIFDIISNRYRRSGWKKVESTELAK